MSTIIKAADEGYGRTSGRPVQHVAFDFSDMAGQAQCYLEQVRARGTEIVRNAEQQAVSIRAAAAREGRESGLNAVQEMVDAKVAAEMQSLEPALNKLLQDVEDAKQVWLNHWQTAAVRLACGIARRLVRRELSARPEITLEWVREALQLAAGSAEMTVRMHPDDHAALGAQVNRLASELAGLAPARIVADSEISPGGCCVETKFGRVDQQVDAQLARMEAELT